MNDVSSRLTVFFDDPFWVGIWERHSDGRMEVAKITFGPEPKDYEVYDFLLKNFGRLRFSPPARNQDLSKEIPNHKRMQRAINRQLQKNGTGTKAMQALKLQHEQCKSEKKIFSRKKKQEDCERQFELKQIKKKEKHKGR